MFHLTLRQIKVFESVARHLSYSRAAKELFLTQPAVSMQVKQLEENVGIHLFEQVGKKVSLTEAGHELNHYARTISRQLTDLEVALDELKGLERGKLNISVVSTANYFTPRLLARFCQLYEGITVSLNVSNRDSVLQQVTDNLTDLAIMGRPPKEMDMESESFMENPLVIIASPDHPLCGESSISIKKLAKETFVVREPGSGTRGAMERFFEEHHVNINQGMEADTTDAIIQAVQAGMGLGIMSRHTVELELETNRLKILDVKGFPIIRYWHVVHRKDKRLSKAAKTFKAFLLQEAPGLVSTEEDV